MGYNALFVASIFKYDERRRTSKGRPRGGFSLPVNIWKKIVPDIRITKSKTGGQGDLPLGSLPLWGSEGVTLVMNDEKNRCIQSSHTTPDSCDNLRRPKWATCGPFIFLAWPAREPPECPCATAGGDCNVATDYLTNSRRKTLNYSGRITVFFRIIASAGLGGEAKLVQRGTIRGRNFYRQWMG